MRQAKTIGFGNAILGGLVVLILLGALSACGGNGTSKNGNEPTSRTAMARQALDELAPAKDELTGDLLDRLTVLADVNSDWQLASQGQSQKGDRTNLVFGFADGSTLTIVALPAGPSGRLKYEKAKVGE